MVEWVQELKDTQLAKITTERIKIRSSMTNSSLHVLTVARSTWSDLEYLAEIKYNEIQ